MVSRLVTGLTPEREQALVERLSNRLARSAENSIRRELGRAMRSMMREDESANEAHTLRMFNILSNLYFTAFDTFGKRMWDATGRSGKRGDGVPLTPQFDLARQIWIRNTAAYKVTEIAGTTLAQAQEIIRQATEDAIAEGLDEAQTARLIQDRINEEGGQLSRLRSRVISRTESHSAANASTQLAAKTSGLPMVKEWIASGLERTRSTHSMAHGQKVGIDEPFNVGGAILMQPGDPNGPAKEVINCRCVVGYSLE